MIKKNLLSLIILDSINNGNITFLKIRQDIKIKQPLMSGENTVRWRIKELLDENMIKEIKSSANFYNLNPTMEEEIKELLSCFSKILTKHNLDIINMEIKK